MELAGVDQISVRSVHPVSRENTVQTTLSGQTIWIGLTEDEFRKHMVALEHRTNAVPVDVQVFRPETMKIDDQPLNLPLLIEQQLANDFAFLAAVKEGAQSVAAACLEQHLSPQSMLKIRIAGADSIEQSVRSTLRAIGDVLMHVTKRLPTHDLDPTDEIFKLIIVLHRSRILARLRSSKWQKPKYLSASHKKPLWQDFENLIHRVQHVYPQRKQRRRRAVVENHLAALAHCYERFEEVTDEGVVRQLAVLIKSTYDFCKYREIQEFAAELEVLRPTSQISAALKCLHQIEKIGAYWRIVGNMTYIARQYPHIFSDIELEYLTPYVSVPTTIAYEPWAKTCHVHAEIQLVVDYDLRWQNSQSDQESSERGTEVFWPRMIGSSKYMCYLCFLFVKFHGHFFAANTHGRLYDQWTVPDLAEYSEHTRQRYVEVIAKIDSVLRAQMDGELCWRAEPMTSRQNLLFDEDKTHGQSI